MDIIRSNTGQQIILDVRSYPVKLVIDGKEYVMEKTQKEGGFIIRADKKIKLD